jgi:hypothetical protein
MIAALVSSLARFKKGISCVPPAPSKPVFSEALDAFRTRSVAGLRCLGSLPFKELALEGSIM